MRHAVRKARNRVKPALKITALLYLQEALLKERYETCREIITQAKSLQVLDIDIQDILEDPRRSVIDTS